MSVLMTDRQLIAAVELHFGGRDRAVHILTCDECHEADDGQFKPCGRCPRREHA